MEFYIIEYDDDEGMRNHSNTLAYVQNHFGRAFGLNVECNDDEGMRNYCNALAYVQNRDRERSME